MRLSKRACSKRAVTKKRTENQRGGGGCQATGGACSPWWKPAQRDLPQTALGEGFHLLPKLPAWESPQGSKGRKPGRGERTGAQHMPCGKLANPSFNSSAVKCKWWTCLPYGVKNKWHKTPLNTGLRTQKSIIKCLLLCCCLLPTQREKTTPSVQCCRTRLEKQDDKAGKWIWFVWATAWSCPTFFSAASDYRLLKGSNKKMNFQGTNAKKGKCGGNGV